MLAITGATGFVGQALLDRAEEQGLELRALARRPQPARKGVEWVPGDLDDAAALRQLVRGAEAVIHVAGVVNEAARFESGNVAGTANVIEGCKAEGVSRLIFVSSLSAREPDLSAYGASKARAERLVMASGLDWTIVRPPGIYGPRDVDYFEMFRLARWRIQPVPSNEGRASIIHVDDLARLLLALVPRSELVCAQLFEPDDGAVRGWSHRDLALTIGKAIGRRPWVIPLGPFWLEQAARIDRALRGDGARLTRDRVGYMIHPDWISSPERQPPPSLWKPIIPTRKGLKATAQWYRDAGWL